MSDDRVQGLMVDVQSVMKQNANKIFQAKCKNKSSILKSGKSNLTIHNDLNEIDLEQNGGFNSKCIVTDIN